jgi:hypothetical protein
MSGTYWDPTINKGLTQLSDHYGVSAELTVLSGNDESVASNAGSLIKMLPETAIIHYLHQGSGVEDAWYDSTFKKMHAHNKAQKRARQQQ